MAAIPKKVTADYPLTPPPEVLVTSDPAQPNDPVQSALIRHALAGSSAAIDQLIRDHQAAVRIFLSRYINCSDTVDDVAQEVFVVAFRDLKKYKHESRFSTWLLGIARLKALTHLRNQMRWRKRNQQYIELEIARQQISRIESDDLEKAAETHEALRHCLNRLPEPSRQLVSAYYYQGQTSDEIGRDTGQKSGTIRMKLMRIRSALQKCIQIALLKNCES